MTLQQCHDKPDGCSPPRNPSHDAYLDFLKDQDPGPTLPSTRSDRRQLPETRIWAPDHAPSHQSRHIAKQFANLGEGNIHTVIGYLYFAEDTGRQPLPSLPTAKLGTASSGSQHLDYHLAFASISCSAAKAGPPTRAR